MNTVDVPLGPRSYPIHTGTGLISQVAGLVLARFRPSSVFVISHLKLTGTFAEPVADGFRAAGVPTTLICIPAGERFKSLHTTETVYAQLAAASADRRSLVVAVGGGVVGDLAGFVAATWMRGIKYVQVPTSLLAQVDAAIGGKTGVNTAFGKNLVGAIHQPLMVVVDPNTLATLPMRQIRSGLAEVIKYGIISSPELFSAVATLLPQALARNGAAFSTVIERSCAIKAQVVGADETEQGGRAVLNYGHTVGHAIERVTRYRRFTHGEAVAIGMISASLVAEELGLADPSFTRQIATVIRSAKLPVVLPDDLPASQLVEAMYLDKKSVGGTLTFVIASSAGQVSVQGNVPPAAVHAALRRHAQGAGLPPGQAV